MKTIEQLQEENAELQEEVEALKYWRKLALQFDGHRMNAMSMLKMVATGNFDLEEVRKFIAAAPVSGDKHLTEIRAQSLQDAIHAVANKYEGSDTTNPWCIGANHVLVLFAKYADSIRKEGQ